MEDGHVWTMDIDSMGVMDLIDGMDALNVHWAHSMPLRRHLEWAGFALG